MWALYIGLTTDATTVRNLVRRFYTAFDLKPPFNPFEHIIVSPLTVQPATLSLLRAWRLGQSPLPFPVQSVSSVIFDSGGYQVQTGRLTFEGLCSRLCQLYRTHNWADFFVLPDFPILSSDTDADIERKLTATLTAAEKALRWLPDSSRAIAVVHARTPSQVRYAVNQYSKLGITYIGFGSFGTSGKDKSVNLLSYRAIALLKTLQYEANLRSMRTHIFGLGVPTNLIRLALAGIKPTSVDTSSWFKSGGFGAVFLPLYRQAHMSRRQAKGWKFTDAETFKRICDIVGHSCPFCSSPADLQHSRWNRILHNLTVTVETVMALQRGR